MPCQLGDSHIQPVCPNYVPYKTKELNLSVMAKSQIIKYFIALNPTS